MRQLFGNVMYLKLHDRVVFFLCVWLWISSVYAERKKTCKVCSITLIQLRFVFFSSFLLFFLYFYNNETGSTLLHTWKADFHETQWQSNQRASLLCHDFLIPRLISLLLTSSTSSSAGRTSTPLHLFLSFTSFSIFS